MPLFLQGRRAVTDLDPSCKAIGASPRVAHVAHIFMTGDGTPSQSFFVDGPKQRRFPPGPDPRFHQIPQSAFILAPIFACKWVSVVS
jgi:hypothetical protein